MTSLDTAKIAGPQVDLSTPGRRRAWMVALVLAIALLLAQMAAGMVTAARQQSQTADEGVYIASAITYLQQHSLRYNPEHPPLAKLVMASGLMFADARIHAPQALSQWKAGRDVLYGHRNGAQRLLWLARLPMIILTLLFGLVVFAFARDLVGPAAGLAALAVYAFSPDVIAFGSLAGVDLPTAGFLLTTLWLLWRARHQPAIYLPLAGLAFGAALATKMTALAAAPVIALLAALAAWRAGRARSHNRYRRFAGAATAVALVAVLAIATVWGTYLVVDPRLRWTAPPGLPVISGLTGQVVDWLPLPAPYRDGMRLQLGFEGQHFDGFMLGHAYQGHHWYYLPIALAIKTPLGMLALWLAGAAAMVAIRGLRPAALYVLLPAAVLLAAAMTGVRDFGVRYAVVVPVILAVAAGTVLASQRRWVRVVAVLLVAAVAVSSLRAFPYYLPYSNEALGGPTRTYLRLGDSNVDWGQDLARLADRLDREYPGQTVWLVHRNAAYAGYYGIAARDPLTVPPDRVHGLLAVSALRVATAAGPLKQLIESSVRVDDVGHSIFIYRRA